MYSLATSTCQVVQVCICNGVAQIAKGIDTLCSQHFEYVSNYGPVTFGIQKLLVEPEAVSQVKKYTVEPLYNGNQNIARCP